MRNRQQAATKRKTRTKIVGDDARCDASEAWYRLLSCDMDDESCIDHGRDQARTSGELSERILSSAALLCLES